MLNHERVTRLRDDQRLAELEKTIARGQKTFVEVGLALAEIRDLRLYKREFSNFAEYCQKKWGWTRQYVDYQIAGAKVKAALPEKVTTMVVTERQTRELAKLPAEKRAEVVQGIVSEGKPLTAAAIKGQLPPPPMARTNGAKETARSAPPPPPPTQILDATGWPIPTQLIPLWQRAQEVQELLTTLSHVKGTLRAAQENRDKLFAEVNFSSALSQLDQAWTDIKTAKPFAVCPTCQGQLPDQCTLCRGRGLISEYRWNTCVPREDKEFRSRAKQKTARGKERP